MDNLYRHIKYLRGAIVFCLFSFLAYIILGEKISDYAVLTGLPILHIQRLLVVNLVAFVILVVSTVSLGIGFIKLYNHLRSKNVPFVGFIWIFGCFKLFMAGIFLMNMLNLWRAYFWIDAMIKVSAALFSLGAAIAFFKSLKSVKDIKTPEEYRTLAEEIKKVKQIHDEIQKIKHPKND